MNHFLEKVQKPGRYLGREWNLPDKDFRAAHVRMLLCFPDLYEIGMSNLGMRILYGIVNGMPDASCERMFSYARDAEAALRAAGGVPFSLETGSAFTEFDIAGFSLGSELDYTNVLKMLSLAGVPLEAARRSAAHPLIIGGGPACMNPEPMYSFFDLFLIGEGEDAVKEIIAVYARHKERYKAGALSKEDLLKDISCIRGVYVPSFYEVGYDAKGRIVSRTAKHPDIPVIVNKRIVEDFEASLFPSSWIVPYIQVVHDRVSLEIMRGCPNRCRFCQSRAQYYPFRQRQPETVFNLAVDACRRSGYEELALTGLSVSDYPRIAELVPMLVRYFKQDAVAVSLPSLKARDMLGDLFHVIADIKKTGLTFAPEAGSRRLRDSLAKDFDEQVFFDALERAYRSGYQHVKLYFMIGLPGETDADLEAIADFCQRTSAWRKKAGLPPAQVNVSVNVFIPKPHTAFQWSGMPPYEELVRRQEMLRSRLRLKRVRASFHAVGMSLIEAILSRGDRRLSAVILRAFERGACFDAWDDHFSYKRWMEAFRDEGVDPMSYLRQRDSAEILPWDFLDICGPKETLLAEYNKAIHTADSGE
jgi:radical SAM family uncharacterized protein